MRTVSGLEVPQPLRPAGLGRSRLTFINSAWLITSGCDNEYCWPTRADEFWPSLPCLTC